MLEARRSELLGRARARAYGERTTTSPTEKSYVSLLCSYIEGWCARVYRLRGGRGWQRRVRTEREREREAFVSRAFGDFRRHPARCTCARENVDIAALVWLVSSPPLSLFDEATASSTHRHHLLLLLLHHPQPFLLLFPSLPFLTTGLPALSLSYSPSPRRSWTPADASPSSDLARTCNSRFRPFTFNERRYFRTGSGATEKG